MPIIKQKLESKSVCGIFMLLVQSFNIGLRALFY